MRQTYTVGALGRRAFRRALQRANLSYSEDSGFLDSQFIVTAPIENHRMIIEWINEVKKADDMSEKVYKVSNSNANEFLDLIEKCQALDPDQTVESVRGWFKTKVEIYTTSDNHKRYQNFVSSC